MEFPEENQHKYYTKSMINKEYDGKKIKEINLQSLNNYKICPLIKGAKYNIFFIIPLLEKKLKTIYLSTYVNESSFYSKSYTIYNHYIISENPFVNIYKENIKCIMIQIPSNEKINNLSICVKIEEKIYNSVIKMKKEKENYFYIQNLNNEITISDDLIFTYFLHFFFNNQKNEEKIKNIQESLVQACMDRISKREIELNVDNIIKIFKLCNKFNIYPKNIDNLEAKIEEKKFRKLLNENLFLSSDEIEQMATNKDKEK